MLVVLWVLLILLRVLLIVVNMIWTAVVGNPLFYDTKILPGRQPRRQRQHDDEVIDDEDQ